MVLLVHGGPWGRDAYGFNGMHQWLANRGYAVLSRQLPRLDRLRQEVRQRRRPANGARKMHDDLLDAVDWAVARGVASRTRWRSWAAATAATRRSPASTFTPDTFACGVDIVGPSNLDTLLETIPPYWEPVRAAVLQARWATRRRREGKALLEDRSPLYKADQIKRPLLIGQGANDPRVKQSRERPDRRRR